MITGKFKFNYLVIKVVLSTVIKGQKRIDLFEDRSRDNYDDRSFSGSIDQILMIDQYAMYWFSLIGSHIYNGELNTP